MVDQNTIIIIQRIRQNIFSTVMLSFITEESVEF